MHKLACTTFPLGAVLGRVLLPSDVAACAAELAGQTWDAAAALEFSGDAVTTFELPDEFPVAQDLLPQNLLQKIGLEIDPDARQELVATYDVDQHEDDIHGLVLFLVLHNDGLKFRQGKVSHVTTAGEFFVFDDRRPHGVKGARGPGAYLGWSIPVRRFAEAD